MAMGLHPRRAGGAGGAAPMAEINVTPMVDVMLVLLIIFMVTAPLLATGVQVDLPDSQGQPRSSRITSRSRSRIDARGAIFIDDDRVPEGELARAAAADRRLARASRAGRASSCAPTKGSTTAG